MKLYFSTILLFLIFSCTQKEDTKNLDLSITITGFQNGKIKLVRSNNNSDSYTVIDSLLVTSDKTHYLKTPLSEPELLHLIIDRNTSLSKDNSISFVAEPKAMHIKTDLNNLTGKTEITGSINHTKYADYKKVIQQISFQELEITRLLLAKTPDSLAIQYILNKLQLKKQLYTINYTFTNKNLEVAPLIAIETFANNNPKMRDSLYNALDPRIQNSLYGKKLQLLLKR